MNHYLPFAFQAEAGTHLPTLEGWKAELALKYGNTCHVDKQCKRQDEVLKECQSIYMVTLISVLYYFLLALSV